MAVGVLLDLAFLCCARPAAEPLYPLSSLSRTHHVPAALCHSTAVVWCIVFCARDFIATLLLTRGVTARTTTWLMCDVLWDDTDHHGPGHDGDGCDALGTPCRRHTRTGTTLVCVCVMLCGCPHGPV